MTIHTSNLKSQQSRSRLQLTVLTNMSMFQGDKHSKQAYPLSGTPHAYYLSVLKWCLIKTIVTVKELAICWLKYPRDAPKSASVPPVPFSLSETYDMFVCNSIPLAALESCKLLRRWVDLKGVISQENCSKLQSARAFSVDHLQVLTGLLSWVSHQEKYAPHKRILSKGCILEDIQPLLIPCLLFLTLLND